jgi:mannose-6-phosphate isomerase
MTAGPVKLPPNPIRHFYRGGPAIAELRGIDVAGDHSPEEWIGSAATLFGEAERGLSRLSDGTLVRDALAAEPET